MRKPLPDFKAVFSAVLLICAVLAVTACSVNPATGERQFTMMMSPLDEQRIGAEEHKKIIQIYGMIDKDAAISKYVNAIGQRLAINTERKDVQYQFFILDTPIVNAFALPGGYVYITRGLLTQANSEAEVAAVLAHEIGHITARHAAARYSRGVLTSLGTSLLSQALDSGTMGSNALGLGSQLFMKSYSQNQETEADALGIRYLYRAEYSPYAMRNFLSNLDQYTTFERALAGKADEQVLAGYFSTHPQTKDRISEVTKVARDYPQAAGATLRDDYLHQINGLVYGHGVRDGFIHGQSFYHTKMGFTFTMPDGFFIDNQPTRVAASDHNGTVIVFDAKGVAPGTDPLAYLTKDWMRGEPLENPQTTTVNGMEAATAAFTGSVSGHQATIRIMAVKWDADTMFRFQLAIPSSTTPAGLDALRRATYSLRRLTDKEKKTIHPYHLTLVQARPGDTMESISQSMPFANYKPQRFRVLNAMQPGEDLHPGAMYKTVTDEAM